MRYIISIISAAVGVSVAASAAVFAADVESLPGNGTEKPGVARQCLTDIQEFDAKLARIGFGLAPPRASGTTTARGYYTWGAEVTPRQKIRSLRDTAYAYALDGNEQNCHRCARSSTSIRKSSESKPTIRPPGGRGDGLIFHGPSLLRRWTIWCAPIFSSAPISAISRTRSSEKSRISF